MQPVEQPPAAPLVRLEEVTPQDEREQVRRFSYEGGEGWKGFGVVAVGRPHPGIRSLEIRPSDPAGDVTAALFRRVSIGALLAEIQKELAAEDARILGVGSMGEAPSYTVEDLQGDAVTLPLPEGYVRMTDALLRRVAEEYLKETVPGKSPRALDRLAETFGRPPETVRTWVSRARKEGWLGAGVRGRLGASPGPRLMGFHANEEEILRAAAVKSPERLIRRTRVRIDPDGVGGMILRDTIPATGEIVTEEIGRVANWREYVDGLEGQDG